MIASARRLVLLTVVGSWSCTLTEAFVHPLRLPRGRPCAAPRPRVGAEATGLAVACGAQVGGDGGCPVAATRRWVEQAVIGMNLCPWARAAVDEGLVQIKLSSAMTVEGLLGDIEAEMRRLAPDNCRDTSIIVTGTLLSDLDDYLRVCDQVNDTIDRLGFDGVLQLATFHPDYQFAGTTRDDAGGRSCLRASEHVPCAQLIFDFCPSSNRRELDEPIAVPGLSHSAGERGGAGARVLQAGAGASVGVECPQDEASRCCCHGEIGAAVSRS